MPTPPRAFLAIDLMRIPDGRRAVTSASFFAPTVGRPSRCPALLPWPALTSLVLDHGRLWHRCRIASSVSLLNRWNTLRLGRTKTMLKAFLVWKGF